MRNLISGNRLPTFTDEESKLLKGSFDYLGLNHYTSSYARYTGKVGRDYSDDSRVSTSPTDINGNLIGP